MERVVIFVLYFSATRDACVMCTYNVLACCFFVARCHGVLLRSADFCLGVPVEVLLLTSCRSFFWFHCDPVSRVFLARSSLCRALGFV